MEGGQADSHQQSGRHALAGSITDGQGKLAVLAIAAAKRVSKIMVGVKIAAHLPGRGAVAEHIQAGPVGPRWGQQTLLDVVGHHQFSLEPMVALSMVAAYSERLKFGTSVLALPLRNPVVLAKQIASLDYLSRGRCFPAVGLGQEDPREYEACGVPKMQLRQIGQT